MEQTPKKNKLTSEVIGNTFGGSLALLSVCVTIISLFQVMGKRSLYYADDFFSLTSIIFAISAIISYLCLRNDDLKILKQIADMIFLIGLLAILIASLILLMEL